MDRKADLAIIQKILLNEWDPIGVSDIPEAQDEYDAYADTVFGMLADQTASDDALLPSRTGAFHRSTETHNRRRRDPSPFGCQDEAAGGQPSSLSGFSQLSSDWHSLQRRPC